MRKRIKRYFVTVYTMGVNSNILTAQAIYKKVKP